MELPSYFIDFLANIRLTPNQVQDLITGHRTLRERLSKEQYLSPAIVSTFLQGSYRRATAVRPKEGQRSDVDVVVVTRMSKDEYSPQGAMDEFRPFLEKHYKGKYRVQGRSIGIGLSYVDLDLVITAAPSESEVGILQSEMVLDESTIEELEAEALTESRSRTLDQMWSSKSADTTWQSSPLLIPDREVQMWKPTHPLEQIRWTWNKNRNTFGHYVNVVKCLKWWKRLHPEPDNPKSYPLEHLIGACCPDGIASVAQGLTAVLETIASRYPRRPVLPDHGVPTHDVFKRVSDSDYDAFHTAVRCAATTARAALDAKTIKDSAQHWRDLLGEKFPLPPEELGDSSTGGFTERKERGLIGGGRFACE